MRFSRKSIFIMMKFCKQMRIRRQQAQVLFNMRGPYSRVADNPQPSKKPDFRADQYLIWSFLSKQMENLPCWLRIHLHNLTCGAQIVVLEHRPPNANESSFLSQMNTDTSSNTARNSGQGRGGRVKFMKSDQSQDSADHNKSRGKGKGYVKPDPDADPEEEDKPSKSTYADIAKSILKSSPKISDPPKAAKKPEEKVEIPFYIPDDPEDKEEEAEVDLEADNIAMEESVAEEAPEDVQEESKARAAIQEASAKASADILDLLEDPAHIVTSKWLVLMNLPSKITEDGLREILKFLDRSLNLQMKTDKSQVARMKKAMRRSSLLNKAHSVVARQWTMVELPKALRFRPQATPSDDDGEFAPFALLEKTWVPGADTGPAGPNSVPGHAGGLRSPGRQLHGDHVLQGGPI